MTSSFDLMPQLRDSIAPHYKPNVKVKTTKKFHQNLITNESKNERNIFPEVEEHMTDVCGIPLKSTNCTFFNYIKIHVLDEFYSALIRYHFLKFIPYSTRAKPAKNYNPRYYVYNLQVLGPMYLRHKQEYLRPIAAHPRHTFCVLLGHFSEKNMLL